MLTLVNDAIFYGFHQSIHSLHVVSTCHNYLLIVCCNLENFLHAWVVFIRVLYQFRTQISFQFSVFFIPKLLNIGPFLLKVASSRMPLYHLFESVLLLNQSQWLLQAFETFLLQFEILSFIVFVLSNLTLFCRNVLFFLYFSAWP